MPIFRIGPWPADRKERRQRLERPACRTDREALREDVGESRRANDQTHGGTRRCALDLKRCRVGRRPTAAGLAGASQARPCAHMPATTPERSPSPSIVAASQGGSRTANQAARTKAERQSRCPRRRATRQSRGLDTERYRRDLRAVPRARRTWAGGRNARTQAGGVNARTRAGGVNARPR